MGERKGACHGGKGQERVKRVNMIKINHTYAPNVIIKSVIHN